MKKLFLLASILLITRIQAEVLDAIAVIVEGEAITTAEIRAVKEQMKVSKSEAVKMLIENRLQHIAMKDITIEEELVDEKIAKIAAQNNLTIPQMQKILKEQGTTWNRYRKSIRDALKKEKFFKEKVVSSISAPTEDELKLFYRNHKEEFAIPASITMTEYTASSEEKMKKFLSTNDDKYVKSRLVTKKTKELNPELLSTLLSTADGAYTRPFNAGDRYIVYKITSKKGTRQLPFEDVKPGVTLRWKQQQQNKALKDYFEKLRTSANIQMIRE